jgi:hypothetical protein
MRSSSRSSSSLKDTVVNGAFGSRPSFAAIFPDPWTSSGTDMLSWSDYPDVLNRRECKSIAKNKVSLD